jgi:hypothetical protein
MIEKNTASNAVQFNTAVSFDWQYDRHMVQSAALEEAAFKARETFVFLYVRSTEGYQYGYS